MKFRVIVGSVSFPPLYRSSRTFPSFSSPVFQLPSRFFLSTNLLPFRVSGYLSPHFLVSKQEEERIPIMAACIEAPYQANPVISRDPNSSQTPDSHCKMTKSFRPTISDQVSCTPICHNRSKSVAPAKFLKKIDHEEDPGDDLWREIKEEARSDAEQEPILSNYYQNSILSHKSLEFALANHLSVTLGNSTLPCTTLFDLFLTILTENQDIIKAVKQDLRAVKQRDPACISYVHCFLNFKGFLACQSHRISHKLWTHGRKTLALLIQNRVSEAFGVDFHPGAKIGHGILLDHATGLVVGETAVIGNNVSILHNVTLGGTGKDSGDRHPKIGDGVLIGAGTCILGNIRIGEGAKIGACSVVLKDVPPRTTAVGNPARLIGGKENPTKLDKIPSFTMDHTSHISEWCDYII